jgi:hypothetical protein
MVDSETPYSASMLSRTGCGRAGLLSPTRTSWAAVAAAYSNAVGAGFRLELGLQLGRAPLDGGGIRDRPFAETAIPIMTDGREPPTALLFPILAATQCEDVEEL